MFKQTLLFFIICTTLISCSSKPKKKNSQGLNNKQVMLMNGYAQLHNTMKSTSLTDRIFYVKLESDHVEGFGEAYTSEAKKIRAKLEDIQKKYTWIDLKNTGAPEIGQRKLDAVIDDRLKSFMPMVGRSGVNFERTLLLSLSAVLNQMRHLAKVMLEIEKNKERRAFLKETESSLNELYKKDLELLNAHYFCSSNS